MGDDDPYYQTVRNRLGPRRKEVLQILYDSEKPKRIGEVFGEDGAGIPDGSWTHNLRWLSAGYADDPDSLRWWPEHIGPLVEVVDRVGKNQERVLALTEEGEAIADGLRDDGEIVVGDDLATLRDAFNSIAARTDGLPAQVEENDNRIKNLANRIEELEGIDKKLDGLREDIAKVNDELKGST